MSSTQFSVFIPRVFANIGERRIGDVFHDMGIGNVSHVDLKSRPRKQGEPKTNMAFVHFKELYERDGEEGVNFRKKVENKEECKIMYEDPWFWLVLPFEKKEKFEMPRNPYPQMPMQMPMQNFGMFPGGWMMTPQGPMWFPADNTVMGFQHPMPPPPKMVPPQVAYGNRSSKQRPSPKKRINPPKLGDGPTPKEAYGTNNQLGLQIPTTPPSSPPRSPPGAPRKRRQDADMEDGEF